MLKFFQQDSDYFSNKVGVFVVCPYLTEGWSYMSMQPDGTGLIPAVEPKIGGQDQAAQDEQSLQECLQVANRLLGLIQDETRALKAFDTDMLLQLVTQKEALVRDLGGRLNVLKKITNGIRSKTDHGADIATTKDIAVDWRSSETAHKRQMLREVLSEIERGNEINRIFIQGSLAYGDELLELFVPGTYGIGQEGQAERLTLNTKGLALDKEV
jgi:flagellar biosynthesis/type III secretory pathway chaperone